MLYLLQTIYVPSIWAVAKFLLCHLDILLTQRQLKLTMLPCSKQGHQDSIKKKRFSFCWSERRHEDDLPLGQWTTSCLVMWKQSALLGLAMLFVFLKIVCQNTLSSANWSQETEILAERLFLLRNIANSDLRKIYASSFEWEMGTKYYLGWRVVLRQGLLEIDYWLPRFFFKEFNLWRRINATLPEVHNASNQNMGLTCLQYFNFNNFMA